MVLTPLDIQKKEFKRAIRGYDPDEVDDFLDLILKDYEMIFRKNFELEDIIHKLEDEIERFKKLEDTLHSTMVLAQRTAEEVRQNAEQEAELIFREAKAKSENIVRDAENQIKRVQQDYEVAVRRTQQFRMKFKAFLLAQLEMIDGKDLPPEKAKEIEELADFDRYNSKDEDIW